MKRNRTAATAFVAALALGGFAAQPLSAAAQEEPEPCATQQTQVERAEEALARVTAVFERQKDRVAREKRQLDKADTRAEKRAERADLARAKAKKERVAKEKKAQQMRLAKATQRLESCLAANG